MGWRVGRLICWMVVGMFVGWSVGQCCDGLGFGFGESCFLRLGIAILEEG